MEMQKQSIQIVNDSLNQQLEKIDPRLHCFATNDGVEVVFVVDLQTTAIHKEFFDYFTMIHCDDNGVENTGVVYLSTAQRLFEEMYKLKNEVECVKDMLIEVCEIFNALTKGEMFVKNFFRATKIIDEGGSRQFEQCYFETSQSKHEINRG